MDKGDLVGEDGLYDQDKVRILVIGNLAKNEVTTTLHSYGSNSRLPLEV
ncbi:hypothetical protein [Desulfosporosinus shakirovi]|nr:hypothetical protein [Desulfosporosinus sp. SRJS8]MCB8818111.1 hypothetical protein [Desulfosporosinus sp. SRJS8]